MISKTIAAIATPSGPGGIGIIKISGPDAIQTAASLFQPGRAEQTGPGSGWKPRPRHLHYGHVVDPDSRQVIDEVLFAAMPAPFSYTGEDVAEIQAHSGNVVLQQILDLLLSRGISPASPGEFTQRAFLNGRIDLTQAEAVMDLIQARSRDAAALAARQLTGSLSDRIQCICSCLLEQIANLEAAIDFPGEGFETADPTEFTRQLRSNVLGPLQELLSRYEGQRFRREGLSVAICGPPNAGKSSLLNRLLDQDRAIVTSRPGTTRDLIREEVLIEGVSIFLSDTAGLQDSLDPVESAGIDKAFEAVAAADLVILVLDISEPFPRLPERLMGRLEKLPAYLALNKTDLPASLALPEFLGDYPQFRISARYGRGIQALRERVVWFAKERARSEASFVPSLRHCQALEGACRSVESAIQAALTDTSEEVLLIDLYSALEDLYAITGASVHSEVLDHIFSKFCVGK
jgi:tRNA modification GTPase